MGSETITVQCPDCGSEMVIDAKTGKLLFHESKAEAPADFDALLKDLDEQKARAEKIFEQEKAAHEDRDRLLEERFEEALKRAEESSDEKPIRPFDLD